MGNNSVQTGVTESVRGGKRYLRLDITDAVAVEAVEDCEVPVGQRPIWAVYLTPTDGEVFVVRSENNARNALALVAAAVRAVRA